MGHWLSVEAGSRGRPGLPTHPAQTLSSYFFQGNEAPFSFNSSSWQGSSHRPVFLPDMLCLAACGLVLPAEIPRRRRAGHGGLRRTCGIQPSLGPPAAARSCVLKGIDYVLLKWALNWADPWPGGWFKIFFCTCHLLPNTAANASV